jgi:hypothetical protein
MYSAGSTSDSRTTTVDPAGVASTTTFMSYYPNADVQSQMVKCTCHNSIGLERFVMNHARHRR